MLVTQAPVFLQTLADNSFQVGSLSWVKSYSRALHGLILAIAGKTDEAKAILNELRERPKRDYHVALTPLADTCSVLGEKDEAFEFLEAAYQQRVGLLIFLGVRPTLDNIRSDARFADLLRRMGLPEVSLPQLS